MKLNTKGLTPNEIIDLRVLYESRILSVLRNKIYELDLQMHRRSNVLISKDKEKATKEAISEYDKVCRHGTNISTLSLRIPFDNMMRLKDGSQVNVERDGLTVSEVADLTILVRSGIIEDYLMAIKQAKEDSIGYSTLAADKMAVLKYHKELFNDISIYDTNVSKLFEIAIKLIGEKICK